MRATIHQLLVAEASLTAVIPTERWFQVGNVVDVPKKPFAILRWITPVPGNASGTFAQQLRIELYDDRQSYKRIDELLGGPYRTGGIYAVLSSKFGVTGPDGWLGQADFLGNGGDDVNLDFKANFKYSSWQIMGRSF